MINLPPDNLKSFFSYLDKEMSFQGAFATVCGAAAAWIAGTLWFAEPGKLPEVLTNCHFCPTIVKLAAGSFGAAALLALTYRGQLARNYGELARRAALGHPVSEDELLLLVRSVRRLLDPRVVRAQWQYYLARAFLTAGVLLLAMVAVKARATVERPLNLEPCSTSASQPLTPAAGQPRNCLTICPIVLSYFSLAVGQQNNFSPHSGRKRQA
jgi:hypothetical protein